MKIQSPSNHRRKSERRVLSPLRLVILALLVFLLLLFAYNMQRQTIDDDVYQQPPKLRLEQVRQQRYSQVKSKVLNAKLAAFVQLKTKLAAAENRASKFESQLKMIDSYLKEYHRSSELATYLNSIASSVDVPKNLLPKERMRVKEKEKRTQEEESAVKHAADVDKAKQQDSSVAYYETNLGINEGGKTRNVSLLKPILQTKPDYFKTPKRSFLDKLSSRYHKRRAKFTIKDLCFFIFLISFCLSIFTSPWYFL